MDESIINLLNEAAGIEKYVTPITYRTILGQIKSGDIAGAAKGIHKIQRRHAKDKNGGTRPEDLKMKGEKGC